MLVPRTFLIYNVEHTSFHFGLRCSKFVLCLFGESKIIAHSWKHTVHLSRRADGMCLQFAVSSAVGSRHSGSTLYNCPFFLGHDIVHLINTLSAKDGDLRLSASNACLPKTEISVFVTECVFSHPHVINYICSHCMMCYTVRTKKCSSLFWCKAIIVWFSQFIMTDSDSDSDSDALYLAHWPFKMKTYRCIHNITS